MNLEVNLIDTIVTKEKTMGLAIRGYSNLVKVDTVHYDEDTGEARSADGTLLENVIELPPNDECFVDRADGLYDDQNALYQYGQVVRQYMGSYRTYNVWREALAQLTLAYTPVVSDPHPQWPQLRTLSFQEGACEAESGPFFELLCFSDCCGYIGPVTAAKLVQDFKQFRAAAVNWWGESGPDITNYDNLAVVFETAANNGAVVFC